jgi:Leucine-rich repeat (LRR) protein
MNSLQNMRYLDLSGNRIDVIPASLNKLVSLDTLKLNNNLINRIVALPSLRVYHVLNNPVQLMEISCSKMSLEEFGMDWLAYLHESLSPLWHSKMLEDFRLRLGQMVTQSHNNGIDINF